MRATAMGGRNTGETFVPIPTSHSPTFDVRRLMPLTQEMGSGWQESVHPTDLNRVADAYHLAIAGKEPSMRERVCSLGGDIIVHTAPGQGTRIGVRVALASAIDEKRSA